MPSLRNLASILVSTLSLGLLLGEVAPANAQVRAALVRDMDSTLRGTRFAQKLSLNFPAASFSNTAVFAPVVPAGKKLFIQSVSMHTLLTDGQSLMEGDLTVNPGLAPRFWVARTFQAAGSTQRHFTGNLELNLMLGAGETITVHLFRNDNLGSSALNFSNVSFVGYLVDVTP